MGIFRMGHRWESVSHPNTHASIAFKTEWATGTHFFSVLRKASFALLFFISQKADFIKLRHSFHFLLYLFIDWINLPALVHMHKLVQLFL